MLFFGLAVGVAAADENAPSEAEGAMREMIGQVFPYDASMKSPAERLAPVDANVVVLKPVTVMAPKSWDLRDIQASFDRKNKKTDQDNKFSLAKGGTLFVIPVGPLKIHFGGFQDDPDPFGSPGFWSPIKITR